MSRARHNSNSSNLNFSALPTGASSQRSLAREGLSSPKIDGGRIGAKVQIWRDQKENILRFLCGATRQMCSLWLTGNSLAAYEGSFAGSVEGCVNAG